MVRTHDWLVMLTGYKLLFTRGQPRALGCRAAWGRAHRLGTATTGSLNDPTTVLNRFHGALGRV
jgi:hypothetical protein